jgi:hypothetical protein
MLGSAIRCRSGFQPDNLHLSGWKPDLHPRFFLSLSVFLCCLWAFAAPVGARAAAPAFTDGVCAVQAVTMGKMTTWQIKGTKSVINLPAGMVSVTVTVLFQKQANGAANWTDISSVIQTIGAVNNTATIDTGFQNFTPAPASGDQYRIKLSGSYSAGMPPVTKNLVPIASNSVTPVP